MDEGQGAWMREQGAERREAVRDEKGGQRGGGREMSFYSSGNTTVRGEVRQLVERSLDLLPRDQGDSL